MTIQTKIAELVQKLDARYQSIANKVDSESGWSNSPSDEKYPSEALVKTALDTKEITANKVTSWSGTTTNDHYPSEKLVSDSLSLKEDASNKVTQWSSTASDEKYPSEKLVADALADKLEASDLPELPSSTSDLTNDGEDGEHPFITAEDLADVAVTVEKLSTAETGYAHSYVVKQDNVQVGATINIPKDYLVKSATVDTVAAADLTTLGNGFEVGDKYMDFIVNTKGNDGTDEHIYVNVKDLVEDTTYTADGTTLDLTNGEFSVADGGINTTQLADSAVTTAKINNSAVTTDKINDSAVTTAKINNSAVTAAKIADNTITTNQLASSVSQAWTADADSEIEDYIDALITALA